MSPPRLVTQNHQRVELHDPITMPNACAFLWNKHLMIQMNCRGYAVAQFMQPEPARYAHAPTMQAKTFIQPEQPYYAHHPGRFFYIKDEATGDVFSVPYEPVRNKPDRFVFSVGKSDIRWLVKKLGIEIIIELSLPVSDPIELWSLQINNLSGRQRLLSIYPYFPVGYMSWMNQSGEYYGHLHGIICSCVTPYQQYSDYFNNKHFKDKTFLLADHAPDSWQAQQQMFEGEGGLQAPDDIQRTTLGQHDARYETPACIMQHRVSLNTGGQKNYRWLFGPARDEQEIRTIRQTYFYNSGFKPAIEQYRDYIDSGAGCLTIETSDKDFDHFVNLWLPRQLFYHGDVNRLTTDPQTRNYLQDNMGMTYIKPRAFRSAFLHALSQQDTNGSMPDGILIHADAELKYINQIPHTDHCVWLPICLKAYLDETDDYTLLNETVAYANSSDCCDVITHMHQAMNCLLQQRDKRGLSYIAQGDWCDPMNMVGYRGKGVSAWLTLATAYALILWSNICETIGQKETAKNYRTLAKQCNRAANVYFWDGQWFARGITDDNAVFGVAQDAEGRIYLNPQSWAMLSGAASTDQLTLMINAIETQLETPFGAAMLAPAYTLMREDIGRLTQKHPGSAENGSIYNHAAAFYIYGLYTIGEKNRAYRLLRQMIPGPRQQDYRQRGQLPVFIPNYYRGACNQFPRTAGRSSQLFNTGTVSWFYRCLIEGLFGLQGDREGLTINPQLPKEWSGAKIIRHFRGARFDIVIKRSATTPATTVSVDGVTLCNPQIRDFEQGKTYAVNIVIPA